jgi:hypothetical protein
MAAADGSLPTSYLQLGREKTSEILPNLKILSLASLQGAIAQNLNGEGLKQHSNYPWGLSHPAKLPSFEALSCSLTLLGDTQSFTTCLTDY